MGRWNRSVSFLGVLLLFGNVCILTANAVAQTQFSAGPIQRISPKANLNTLSTLSGQVHYLAQAKFDRGTVAPDLAMERITLLLRGTAEQDEALKKLLVEQQDVRSANYHRWLTPEQFGEKFGIDSNDLQTIVAWLQSQEFHDITFAKGRRSIQFSGTASQVATAFRTEVHNFSAYGTNFVSNTSEPAIPAAFASVVRGFASLNSYPRHSSAQYIAPGSAFRTPLAQPVPQFNTTGGGHALTPYDFAAVYNVKPLWSAGINGTGAAIAIVGRSNFWHDESYFRSLFGFPYNQAFQITNGNDPGIVSEQEAVEASLDVEWSGAVAPNATIYYVLSGSTAATDGVDLSAQYAVDNNTADILNVSFGFCEADQSSTAFYQQLWQQAAAQGISVFVSAGDTGSAGCDGGSAKTSTHGLAVSGLASTPDNVAVGGTGLNDQPNPATYWSATNDANLASALGYIPETTWNDSSSTSILAGGGGVSAANSAPIWQVGTGVPTSDPGASGQHHRYLPDVSLNAAAHIPYYVCAMSSCSYVDSNGQNEHYLVYGTSASAPAFAGIMALVVQKAGGRQGNPNFHFYPLSTVAGVYHDVTSGTNKVPCTSGTGCTTGTLNGYTSGAGYDLASGWGSVDVNALVSNWNTVTFKPTSVTVTASPTSFVHGTPINVTVSVSAVSGTPTGGVNAYIVQGNTTTELGAAELANGTATFTSKYAPGGTGTLYLRYAGDGIYGSSVSDGIPITVTPESANITLSPASISLAVGSIASLGVTVVSPSGTTPPTGTILVTYQANYYAFGYALASGPTWLTVSPGFGVGTYNLDVKYSGDGNYNASTVQWPVTVTQGTPSIFLNCNIASDMVVGYSIPCNTTLSIGGPFTTGTVQYSDNGSPIGAPLTVQNNTVQFDLKTLAAGSHQISVHYSGDTNYVPRDAQGSPFNVVAKGTAGLQMSGIGSYAPGQGGYVNLLVQAVQLGPSLNGTAALYDGTNVLATYTVQGSRYWSMTQNLNGSSAPMSLGTHALTLSYTGDPTYADATSSVFNLLISNPDFTITGLGNITVTQGSSSIVYPFITPISGLNGTVSIGCSGAPAEATCTIGPTAQINSTPMLRITTTAATAASMQYPARLFYVPALSLAAVVVVSRRRRANLFALLALFCVVSMVSCGGGGSSPSAGGGGGGGGKTDPGTPKGSYTLTVTATYGSGSSAITHNFPFTLTVQ